MLGLTVCMCLALQSDALQAEDRVYQRAPQNAFKRKDYSEAAGHACACCCAAGLATWPTQSIRSSFPQTGHSSALQVGDWGRNGDMNQSEVADLMTKVASGFQPNFIISSGDNFYESEQEPQMLGHQGCLVA